MTPLLLSLERVVTASDTSIIRKLIHEREEVGKGLIDALKVRVKKDEAD
jgi:hypothetical protein